jgi:hypothetical protein
MKSLGTCAMQTGKQHRDMSKRLEYVKYDDISLENNARFKLIFESILGNLEYSLKDSREKELALNAVEEAFMWVGKAIKSDQIIRELNHEIYEGGGDRK